MVVRRWHGAALLPIDQVLLTLAQDLFFDPADLAIAHKLASAAAPDEQQPPHLAPARAERGAGGDRQKQAPLPGLQRR